MLAECSPLLDQGWHGSVQAHVWAAGAALELALGLPAVHLHPLLEPNAGGEVGHAAAIAPVGAPADVAVALHGDFVLVPRHGAEGGHMGCVLALLPTQGARFPGHGPRDVRDGPTRLLISKLLEQQEMEKN